MKKILTMIWVAFLCTSATMAQEYHYMYDNQALPIQLNTEYAYLLLDGIDDAGQLQQEFSGIEINKFATYQAEVTLKKVPGADAWDLGKTWAEIRFTTPLSPKAYFKQLETMEKDARVVIASPFFKDEFNDKMGLSNLFVVRLATPSSLEKLQALAEKSNVRIIGQNKFMANWFTLSCSKESRGNALELANLFEKESYITAAQPDLMTEDDKACTNDPLFGNQYGLENTGQSGGTAGMDINACDGWANWGTGDPSAVVAILDEGYEPDHPDLAANNSGVGWDTESGTSPAQVLGSHGTACAGVAAAVSDNNEGIAGVCQDCSLMNISNSLASTPNARQRRGDGINWGWHNGADVISNSWVSGVQYAIIDDAIDSALTFGRDGLGTVIVFAAGNSNNAVRYPANSNPDIIAVGANDRNGVRSTFSCFGTDLDVVAPGTAIASTDRQGTAGYASGDYTLSINGTSFACPAVAGLVGLIFSENPCLTHDEVEDIIELSAAKIGGYAYANTLGRPNGTWDDEMGYGIIDVDAALQMVNELYLQNQSINTTEVFQVRGDIYAGREVTTAIPFGDFTVANGGDVEFRASGTINLEYGFNVNLGGTFSTVNISSTNCNDWVSKAAPIAETSRLEGATASTQAAGDAASLMNGFEVYPNPFTNQLNVRFGIAQESALVDLRVFNLQGREVANLISGQNRLKGNHELSFDVQENLPAGIYLVRLNVDGKVTTQKMIKN